MPGRDVIVLGTSMGGVQALDQLVRNLPGDFPAGLLIVQHMSRTFPSMLAQILARHSALPVSFAIDGALLEHGHVYVAPPDYHLLVEPDRLKLSRGARENHFRPSIDPLFRSAARHYGARVIGVLLTGGAGDGVAGLLAVRHAGGVAVVQDPSDAYASGMPEDAIDNAGADYVLPVAEIPGLLRRLAAEDGIGGKSAMNADPIERMPHIVDESMRAQEDGNRRGESSVYSCPECGGVLWQVDQQEMLRFRCHVGHAYYAEQLMEDQAEALEAALWTAVRTFRERATLSRQLAKDKRLHDNLEWATRFEEQAEVAERNGKLIVEHLLNKQTGLFPPSKEAMRSVG